MIVLSLFDGISCARVALERAGIEVKTYYASEIEKNAIAISNRNWKTIQRLGDVREIDTLDESIDLLIGGSPCQDLSIANKERKGLDGHRSSLFWEYIRLKESLKPKYFILENVASMTKQDKETITKAIGVEPVMFDASLVSAQSRKRLFWTNIKFELPEDRNILLQHILEEDGKVDERMTSKGKSFCLTATYSHAATTEKGLEDSIRNKKRTLVGHIGKTNGQANRVYTTEGKSVCLSSSSGGGGAKTGLYVMGRDVGRRLNDEGQRDDGNTDIPITRRIELRNDEKTGTLTSVQKDNLVVSETKVRKLTPIECERLQGLPDGYTDGIAMTNRYKVLGNAFNVDVVTHILSSIKK